MNVTPFARPIGRRAFLGASAAAGALAVAACAGQTPQAILANLSNIGVAFQNALGKLPPTLLPAGVLTKLQLIATDITGAAKQAALSTLPTGTALQQVFGWVNEAVSVAAAVPIPPGLPPAAAAAWTAVGMALSAAQLVLPSLAAAAGVTLPAAAPASRAEAAYRATIPPFSSVASAETYLAGAAAR